MADTIKTNLGPVTAYADAKAHGYTGTREKFGQLLANAGLNLKAAETAKEGAEAAKTAAGTSADAAAASAADAKKTLESIPADYSALSGKVDENTSGISELKLDLTHRAIVNGGKNLIGNEANRLYAVGYLPIGTKLTMSMKDGGLLTGAYLLIYDSNKTLVNSWNAFNDNKKEHLQQKKIFTISHFLVLIPTDQCRLKSGLTLQNLKIMSRMLPNL